MQLCVVMLILDWFVVQFEQSLDATFAFGASSMVGHSPQTPQDMYSIGKGG